LQRFGVGRPGDPHGVKATTLTTPAGERPQSVPADRPDAPGKHPDPDPDEARPADPGAEPDPAAEPPGRHPDPNPDEL
jgi:hypothetical protein